MMNQIERMNRTRKILLWVTLLGTLVAFEIFTFPLFVSSYVIGGSRRFYQIFPGALLVWSLMVVILLLRPRIEKRRLRGRSDRQVPQADLAGFGRRIHHHVFRPDPVSHEPVSRILGVGVRSL